MEKIKLLQWTICLVFCSGLYTASAQKFPGHQLLNHNHEGHDHTEQNQEPFITGNPIMCVTEDDYQRDILPILEQNVALLKEAGKLEPRDLTPKNIGAFQWPLRMSAEYAGIYGVGDYYITGNYADLIYGGNNGKKDWMCATGNAARNYDGHNGADIGPFPFPWLMQKQGSVDMIAAAAGQVIAFQDGNFDRNCASPHIQGTHPGYTVYGNFVALLHPDNSVSLYGHMKNGSVANLEVGQSVPAGFYLGKVGSSGNSSGPHIHFEVRPCLNCSYVEPWWTNNGCNTTVSNSWWANQKPFYDKAILRVMTLASVPGSTTCSAVENNDATESVTIRNHFNSGALVIMGVYLRDFNTGDLLTVRMYSPSNTLLQTWSSTATEYHRWGYSFNPARIMTNAASGTYRVEATFAGKTVNHYFSIGCSGSLTLSGAVSGKRGWISGANISSTQTMSASSTNDLFLEAQGSVYLNPGFYAQSNSKLYVNTNPCTINGAIMQEDDDPQSEELLQSLQVYPNPSNGIFTVRAEYIGESRGATIIVRNSIGQVVTQRNVEPGGSIVVEDFDTRNVSSGMYFVEYRSDSQQHVQKLIIQ